MQKQPCMQRPCTACSVHAWEEPAGRDQYRMSDAQKGWASKGGVQSGALSGSPKSKLQLGDEQEVPVDGQRDHNNAQQQGQGQAAGDDDPEC